MHSSIITLILIGIVVIGQGNAERRYNDDYSLRQLLGTMRDSKRGFYLKDIQTSTRCSEIISDYDYNGGDIDASAPAQVRSVMECGAICESFPACVAWTFDSGSGECWTKKKVPALESSKGAYTGKCESSS